jgi:hypothetical protein
MIYPSRKRHRHITDSILLCGALVVLSIAAPSHAADTTKGEPTYTANRVASNVVELATTGVEDPAQLRGSLSMRAAPMSQVFTVLGAMTPLRFRYASPPDAVLTAEWKDDLLLPSLHSALQSVNWQMRREGINVFVFPAAAPESDSGASPFKAAPHGWQYWNDASPPPRRWMAVDVRKPLQPVQTNRPNRSRSLHKPTTTNSGSNRIVVGWRTEPTAATVAAWKDAALETDASQRPGIGVFVPRAASFSLEKTTAAPTGARSAATNKASVWLRWRLPLRFVPRGARLLLETPVAATLYVNGASLLSRRSGLSTLDLSRVLLVGENYLALHLANVPLELWEIQTRQARRNLPIAADSSPPSNPLFRYEWVFDGALSGSQTDGVAE